MIATESDAHIEWHQNAGVPVGRPGCPQDACDPPEDFALEDDEAWLAEYAADTGQPVSTVRAAALREFRAEVTEVGTASEPEPPF